MQHFSLGAQRTGYASAVARSVRNLPWAGCLSLCLLLALLLAGLPAQAVAQPAAPTAFGPNPWNTFFGSAVEYDSVAGVARFGDNAAYYVGGSKATWGTPVRAYTPGPDPEYAGSDVFAAKTDDAGNLLWNTFLGSAAADDPQAIATDAVGNAYVLGYSYWQWGDNADPDARSDTFVAKLTADGTLAWVRFLGGEGMDYPGSLALDASGNAYVVGHSDESWGRPIRPFTTGYSLWDGYLAKLSPDGALLWNTFLGGAHFDTATAVAVSGTSVYVAGKSAWSWGTPVDAFGENDSGFIASLTTDGALTWNTFFGTEEDGDNIMGITVDAAGQLIVAGSADYELPPNDFMCDGIVAKVGADGDVLWVRRFSPPTVGPLNAVHTAADGRIIVAGATSCGYSRVEDVQYGKVDGLILYLDADGNLESTSFVGGPENDVIDSFAVVDDAHLLVGGYSAATWGTPVRAFSGDFEGFAAFVQPVAEQPKLEGHLYLPLLAAPPK